MDSGGTGGTTVATTNEPERDRDFPIGVPTRDTGELDGGIGGSLSSVITSATKSLFSILYSKTLFSTVRLYLMDWLHYRAPRSRSHGILTTTVRVKFAATRRRLCTIIFGVNMSELATVKDLTGSSSDSADVEIGQEITIETKEELQGDPTKPRYCVYWHPACAEHEIPHHPEQPDRVNYMMDALKVQRWPKEGAGGERGGDMFRLAPMCEDDHVLLYHTPSHLKRFQKICQRTELVKEKNEKTMMLAFDSDTKVMWATREATYRACGAMIAAIDSVYGDDSDKSKVDTAFCCTRPPGHHAERSKAQGFCFFNNAAIGAKYAQQKYGESHGIRKVAVMDFDVHHGNGTEEGFEGDESLFYGSTHEKDNYPGTGIDPSPYVGESAKNEIDRRIVNRYLIGGDGDRQYKKPDKVNKSSRSDFRIKWTEVVEEMKLFNPDLVIFSAGFDAHSSDPLGNCWLEDEDFYWATEVVLAAMETLDRADKVADTHIIKRGKRKAVSTLEGGYDLEAISSSAVQHVRALARLTCTATTPENAAALSREARLVTNAGAEVSLEEALTAVSESLGEMGITEPKEVKESGGSRQEGN